MDFLHVVGARPNFPKLAPVYAALKKRGATQYVVHTGQHFDRALSEVLFEQLGLPPEDINLGVGSGSHAQQTAAVMVAIEQVLLDIDPKMVLVYGDVNSTAAATIVASKLGIPVAHIEAGLRSNDRSMPEELNRLITDVLASYSLTTSPDAGENLLSEGVDKGSIFFVGNPMIDSLRSVENSLRPSDYVAKFGLKGYAMVTLHRPGNVDNPASREAIIDALIECAAQIPLVFPVHPRKRDEFSKSRLGSNPNVLLVEPMGYMEFLSAVKSSAVVITDSGGVQEETTAFGVPCLTLRPNTERPVTITNGTNQLVTKETLAESVTAAISSAEGSERTLPDLWDGNAGTRIADVLTSLI